MSTAVKLATAADLAYLDPERGWEILGGEIVEKAAPTWNHGRVQSRVVSHVGPPFDRRPGGSDGPGGWWVVVEVDIEFDLHDIIRPDIAGWRRERVPEAPEGFPVRIRPDWVCEVLSPSTARRDLGAKRRLLHAHEVPWYWTVDPVAQFVQVLRWTSEGYLVEATAEPGEHVGLPPFEAVELDVGRLFGIEPEEPVREAE